MFTVGELYSSGVRHGIKVDPRGEEEVLQGLKRVEQKYNDMKEEEKGEFDIEMLTNPYRDTRILYGEPDRVVEHVLIGVDMEIGEVLLAERLIARGQKIDLIIAHHPEGSALAGFYDVMHLQADFLNKHGVPINVAEGILKERISEVERRVLPINHQRAVDAARLFDIPFMCLHTPCDNMVTDFVQKRIDEDVPRTIKDTIKLLKDIPEYRQGFQQGAGPKVVAGSPDNRAGKIIVEMTGGTEGSKKAMGEFSRAGVGTIIGMHFSDDLKKEAEKNHVNLIVAGHIPSDNIGLNLMMDKLTAEHKLDIVACSGFKRIER
ncbi:MAG: NGG1p interacting factor NIF3 [Candidatus Desantisbacteria bacterium]